MPFAEVRCDAKEQRDFSSSPTNHQWRLIGVVKKRTRHLLRPQAQKKAVLASRGLAVTIVANAVCGGLLISSMPLRLPARGAPQANSQV